MIITALARRLTLPELGAYGLVAPLAAYFVVLQRSVANSVIRALAAAADNEARARFFSSACVLYTAAGLGVGIIISVAGSLIAEAVLDGQLEREARLGAPVLGVVVALGLCVNVYLDALRGTLLFTQAAATDIASLVLYLALMISLIAADASLWALIAASGALPLLSGLLAAAVVRAARLPYQFSRRHVTRKGLRQLLPTAGYLLMIDGSTIVIHALDRIILGVFLSAATVGLYEGPMRAHNLFYGLMAALTVIAMPAASRYSSEEDWRRLRELILRGSRYSLAITVPVAITLMALARPILEVWLGDKFGSGALALTVLVSYWLLYGAIGATPGTLVGAGRARSVAYLMAAVACTNLAMSFALTPLLGLEGPAFGTAIPYVIAFPFVLRITLSIARVPLTQLLHEVWLPAYSLGICLASGLIAVRLTVPIHSFTAVAALAISGLSLYWFVFYHVWLRPTERSLVREIAAGILNSGFSRTRV